MAKKEKEQKPVLTFDDKEYIIEDMTDEQKDTAIINKRNAYEALKNNSKFTTKEEQDYIDQLGKSDNFNLYS